MPLDPKGILQRANELHDRVGTWLTSRGYKYVDDPTSSRNRWVKVVPGGLEIRVFDWIHSSRPKVCPELVAVDSGKTVIKMTVCSIIADESMDKFREYVPALEDKAAEVTKTRCPHCGGIMGERTVKKEGEHQGKTFLGCLRYPECHGVRAPWKTTAAADEGKWNEKLKCPDCGAPMAVRYAKRWPNEGKRFFGCTRYPNCKKIIEIEEATALMLMDEAPPSDPMQDLADNMAALNPSMPPKMNQIPTGNNPFGTTP